MSSAAWLLPRVDAEQARALAASARIEILAARVLVRRGYHDPAAASRFLNPSLADLHDPFLMSGMRAALERIVRAIAGREKILLYGDYDVDGATSVAMFKKAIELAGGDAGFFIPHRLNQGYGIHAEAIDRAAADGVRLLISLDTGIRATDAVCRARRLGIDVIVTDHHLPDAELPPASAVLNPKQPGCEYPEKDLCGAGVAFKLVQALLGNLGWEEARVRRLTESFLKIVAIATVADVVPLTGENRVIVKHGLDGLRKVRAAGLKALMRLAGFDDGAAPSAPEVAFRLAPRLNAAGRMADANDVVELLLTCDEARAQELAGRMHDLNRDRQDTEAGIVRMALESCLERPVTDSDAALVFCGDGWHRGVVGIVASRLVERFHRPVFVLGAEQGIAQGSGRSIPEFHLLEALESMREIFLRFGGHRQAAGVGLCASRVDEFRDRLNAYAAARLRPEDFVRRIEVDAVAGLDEISDRAVEDVLALAPFGFGNPAPVFVMERAKVEGAPAPLGERHLRVVLRQNGRTLALKAWNCAERAPELQPGAVVDAVFGIEEDDYSRRRGHAPWCAVLKDFRAAR